VKLKTEGKMLKIQLWHHRNKLYLKYIKTENSYCNNISQYHCFTVFFNRINIVSFLKLLFQNVCLCFCLPDTCFSSRREREEDNEMADFLQTKFPNKFRMKSMYLCVCVCERERERERERAQGQSLKPTRINIHSLSISIIVLLSPCSSWIKMETKDLNKEPVWMLILFSGC